eukprot:4448925-Alexandrium_andersonii.AAC.1
MLPKHWTGSTVFRLKGSRGAPVPEGNLKSGSRTAAAALQGEAEFQELGCLLGELSATQCPDSGPLASFSEFRICGL